MREEDQAVVQALSRVGMRVGSVYDLVNTKTPYPEAIPVLISMLPQVTHDRIKEGVARALMVREARPVAARPLLREFREVPAENESQRHTKAAIGLALSFTADESLMDDVVALMNDKRHGWSRAALPLALPRMVGQRSRAIRELVAALEDPNLVVSALEALGRMRAKEARQHVEPFLADPESRMRRLAKRVLARMDKG